MKIGLFGGTFNPIHSEHIALAESAIKDLGLDKLIVMPTFISPHKQGKAVESGQRRLHMARLAFSGNEKVEVSDYEIKKEGTSFSYLTCEYLRSVYPEDQIFFIMGTDMLFNFYSWRYPERIVKAVDIAVCRRNDERNLTFSEQAHFKQTFGKNFYELSFSGTKVSSTLVRTLVALGESVENYTCRAVDEYIRENQLYSYPCISRSFSLLKEERISHSKRVALMATAYASKYKISEEKALLAGALHDCGKYLRSGDKLLEGFRISTDVPRPVIHQYSGAYVAEKRFGIIDEEILNAIRYHTSGRANMCPLEKLILISDMIEPSRNFSGVDELRKLLDKDLDECLFACLTRQLNYLHERGYEIYPKTQEAFDYIKKQLKGEIKNG